MLRIAKQEPSALELEAQGTLDKSDYDHLVPRLEEAAEDGPLRVIVHLNDFRGWTPRALIEDLRYDIRHRGDFEKMAIVGEKKLEKWATIVSKPIFSGDVKFFESPAAARAWIAGPETADA